MTTREEDRKFHDWRVRVNAGLPALANRVFQLRGNLYSGRGFHWGLERDLGVVIAHINDYDRSFDLAGRILLEVRVEEFRCGCQLCNCQIRTAYGEPCQDCENHAHQG